MAFTAITRRVGLSDSAAPGPGAPTGPVPATPRGGVFPPGVVGRHNMEWQMVRILLIFRLLHAIQLFVTVPGTAARLDNPLPGAALLAAIAVESGWFVTHLVRNRRRSAAASEREPGPVYDLRAAYVELGFAVVILLACAVALPRDHRPEELAPLVALTTEQITGAAIGSSRGQPLRILVGGTAAIVVAYGFAIGIADPSALGRSDVLVGLTGFVALAYLIRRGALFLLSLAGDLADLGQRLSAQEQRGRLMIEMHNHLGNTLVMFQRLDPGNRQAVERTRDAVVVAAERLNTFVATGRFAEDLPLFAMLHRQVGQAAALPLHVDLVVASRIEESTAAVDPDRVTMLEEAVRAVLINVPRNAGVDEALLYADLTTEPNGAETVEVVVTDHGRGFPPEILQRGLAATRSLAVHAARLAERGGSLTLDSEPGCTQVTLRLPARAPDRTTPETP